jgi:predicted murein hydrolase (TIGR00659 family)
MGAANDIWVYLNQSPLLWLTVTVVCYALAHLLYQACGAAALLNPVWVSIVAIIAVLSVTGTAYDTYFAGAQFVHFLLGPATVALAVPLYRQLDGIRRSALPILAGLIAGSLTAVLSAVGIAWALGASPTTLGSLAPKSVTTPIAMGVAEEIGAIPSLTAVLVILTGVFGAVIVTSLMNAMRIRDWRARGLAVGVASHGIGTARAFQVNDVAGTYAGIGMGLNGLLTAALVPLLVLLL